MAKSDGMGRDSYELVFQHIPMPIAYMDTQFNFIHVNKAYAEAAGKTPEFFVAKNYFNLYADTEKQDSFRQVVETGKAYHAYAKPFEDGNEGEPGIALWDWSLLPVRGGGGDISGVLLQLVDMREPVTDARIAQEKKTQDALRLQAQIISQIHDAVISTDLEGFVKSWNQGAERLFGYTPGEMLGRHISEVYPEEEHEFLHRGVIAPFQEKGSHEAEVCMRRKSGEDFYAHLALSLLHDEDGTVTGMIGYSSDITERKKAEFALAGYRDELEDLVKERTQDLRLSLRKLEEENEERIQAENSLIIAKEEAELANRQKSQFISRMSHELRTPMNAILGFGQILRAEVADENLVDLVTEIMRASSHLLGLIDEVLELSTIEAGNYSVVLEDVSLYAVVEESISLVAFQAEQSGIRMISRLSSDNDIFVRSDRRRLKEVIINLLTNAIKYNSEHGEVSIEREDPGSDDRVRLLVRDTGKGISQEHQKNLFEPFDRLGAEYTEVPGTGIGLSICRHLMDLMGGDIGVQSEPGKGSVFWLDCPLGNHPFADSGDENAAPRAVTAKSTRSLLYVEDNQANRRLMECIIAQHGHLQMTSALTAEEGIKAACEKQPDLIVLDIHLPGMNGFEALELLKANKLTKHIPVVALSAAASAVDIEKGVQAGFKRYLTKPIDVHEFLGVVQEELGFS